jgi:rare lipoprotein A
MRLLLLTTILFFSAFGLKAQDKTGNILTKVKNGIASFYHDKFEGRKTATGEVFDNDKYTAACNTLKLGSFVKVTNLSNGEVVYVKVNDRMAANNQRLIDLASIAAKKLDFHSKGVAKVKLEVVSPEEGRRAIIAQNGGLSASGNKL